MLIRLRDMQARVMLHCRKDGLVDERAALENFSRDIAFGEAAAAPAEIGLAGPVLVSIVSPEGAFSDDQ
ncbi:MAG: hypothetical protein R3D44_11950 [Hyphomicrobiaceae bacterium]